MSSGAAEPRGTRLRGGGGGRTRWPHLLCSTIPPTRPLLGTAGNSQTHRSLLKTEALCERRSAPNHCSIAQFRAAATALSSSPNAGNKFWKQKSKPQTSD